MPFLTEPLEIVKCIGPSTFQLRDGTKWNARRLVHVFKASAPSPDTSSFIHDAPIKIELNQNLNRPQTNHDFNRLSLPDLELKNSCAAVTRPQRDRRHPVRLRDYEINF